MNAYTSVMYTLLGARAVVITHQPLGWEVTERSEICRDPEVAITAAKEWAAERNIEFNPNAWEPKQ